MNNITVKTLSTFVDHLNYNTQVNPNIWTVDVRNQQIKAFDNKIIIRKSPSKGVAYELIIENQSVFTVSDDDHVLSDQVIHIGRTLMIIYSNVFKQATVIELDSKVIKCIDSYEQYYNKYVAINKSQAGTTVKTVDETSSNNMISSSDAKKKSVDSKQSVNESEELLRQSFLTLFKEYPHAIIVDSNGKSLF